MYRQGIYKIAAVWLGVLSTITSGAQVDERPFKQGKFLGPSLQLHQLGSDASASTSYYQAPVFTKDLPGTIYINPAKTPAGPLALSGAHELLDTTSFWWAPTPYYLKTAYVSNSEFQAFEHYVRDSIIRYTLGTEMDGDYLISYKKRKGLPYINWKKKIDLKKPDVLEELNHLFYPEYESIQDFPRQWDTRKWEYKWWVPKARSNLSFDRYVAATINPDSLMWLRGRVPKEQEHYRTALAEYYSWLPHFAHYAFVGAKTHTAKAFLDWKETFHQRYLDRQKIPLRVQYTLPAPEELHHVPAAPDRVLEVSGTDSNFALIANEEYLEFMHWVRDSLVHIAFAEDVDPSFAFSSEERGYYVINWKKRIPWKHLTPDMQDAMKMFQGNFGLYRYEWTWIHFPYAVRKPYNHKELRDFAILRDDTLLQPDTALWLKHYPEAKHIFDSRYAQNQMFGIDYKQASAYYVWHKQHRSGKVKKNALPHYWIIPSKAEWEALQQGKSYPMEVQIPYPNTRFRYVVRFFPK